MKHSKIISFTILIFIGLSIYLFVTDRRPQVQKANPSLTPTISTKTTTPVSISGGNIPPIPFKLPPGFVIHELAAGLGTPRDLTFSPGGTLLVSNPSSNQVYALPDSGQNGQGTKKVVISNENHVHGLAFYNGQLFIAAVDKVVRYNWDESSLTATRDKVLFSLPKNNNHNNRTLIFDKNGILYVSVGSTCNICIEKSTLSGTVIVSNSNGDAPHPFAVGLRNAPFMAFNPKTNELWATEMGRDNLGDDIPPDEINIIKSGNNYGWPNCYGRQVHDTTFDNTGKDCGITTPPIFEIPAHSAPLGLAFINSNQFPQDWQNDLLVSYHGSWNRSTPTGYKIVHLKVEGSRVTGAEDFISGFIDGRNVLGRPVDLIFDNLGNLYVSDDKAGKVYIIQKTSP